MVTFSELYLLSGYATDLQDDLERADISLLKPDTNESAKAPGSRRPPKIALLCSSNTNFIPAWLGLMRLGLPVLLIGYTLLSPPWTLGVFSLSLKTLFTDS